jgi:hypothetical protein
MQHNRHYGVRDPGSRAGVMIPVGVNLTAYAWAYSSAADHATFWSVPAILLGNMLVIVGVWTIADARRPAAGGDPVDLADDDCLRMGPGAVCPAAGSPRCSGCVWRPAE